MKWRWQCALFLLLSASISMLCANGLFHGICSELSVYSCKTLATYIRLK
jgi:hypothetical protein